MVGRFTITDCYWWLFNRLRSSSDTPISLFSQLVSLIGSGIRFSLHRTFLGYNRCFDLLIKLTNWLLGAAHGLSHWTSLLLFINKFFGFCFNTIFFDPCFRINSEATNAVDLTTWGRFSAKLFYFVQNLLFVRGIVCQEFAFRIIEIWGLFQ